MRPGRVFFGPSRMSVKKKHITRTLFSVKNEIFFYFFIFLHDFVKIKKRNHLVFFLFRTRTRVQWIRWFLKKPLPQKQKLTVGNFAIQCCTDCIFELGEVKRLYFLWNGVFIQKTKKKEKEGRTVLPLFFNCI